MGFKLNPLGPPFDISTSSTSSSSDNFSYEHVETSATITIPQYQQMIVHDIITIDGLLDIQGTMVLIL